MVYDSARGRAMLFGGTGAGFGYLADSWEWDGQSWIEVTPDDGAIPPARALHAMAHEASRQRMVLFGGDAVSEYIVFQDTWEWNGGALASPAFQFSGDLRQLGIDLSNIDGIRVRAHCGGAFAPYEEGDVGATLFGWATGGPGLPPGSWQPLAANDAPAFETAPHLPAPPAALIDWRSLSADEARRYVFDRTLNFQCRPSGLAGPGSAPGALDYIEVRVSYEAR